MRHLRRTVLATVAVVLCAAPIAAADENSGRPVVAPARAGGMTGGELLGEDWARGLARPLRPDPYRGSCRPFVGNVLTPGWVNDTATCTITQQTRAVHLLRHPLQQPGRPSPAHDRSRPTRVRRGL
jgi:hypothetical protein